MEWGASARLSFHSKPGVTLSAKSVAKSILPDFVFRTIRNGLWRLTQRMADSFNQTLSRRGDFSSPLPDLDSLARHRARWDRPGDLAGVRYDLAAMKRRLEGLIDHYGNELDEIPDPEVVLKEALGWGYPTFDAKLLYLMLRDIKPKRYIEIGSGMSSLYATIAAKRNAADGSPLQVTCIEPYPTEKLKAMAGVELNIREVQDVPPDFFASLGDGDLLFIDSSHVLKIDSDVAYLYLQVIPSLARGVYVHCHDIPFPYSTPHPSDLWVLNGQDWAMFWTEAMLLQAFLAFNESFEIVMSTPLIRHFDEPFLRSLVKGYQGIDQQKNTFSSLWMRRVK
jgi:hypothetical protein